MWCQSGRQGHYGGRAICCDARCTVCGRRGCLSESLHGFRNNRQAAMMHCCLTEQKITKLRGDKGLPALCQNAADTACLLPSSNEETGGTLGATAVIVGYTHSRTPQICEAVRTYCEWPRRLVAGVLIIWNNAPSLWFQHSPCASSATVMPFGWPPASEANALNMSSGANPLTAGQCPSILFAADSMENHCACPVTALGTCSFPRRWLLTCLMSVFDSWAVAVVQTWSQAVCVSLPTQCSSPTTT